MTDVAERVKTYQQFIGGEFVDSASGETLEVENPANGRVMAPMPSRRTPTSSAGSNRPTRASRSALRSTRSRSAPTSSGSSPARGG